MNFFTKLLGGGASGGGNGVTASGSFSLGSYTVTGEVDAAYEGTTLWSMRAAERTKGAVSPQVATREVTLFEYAPGSRPREASADQLARNALRRTKTLRHPAVLAFVDASAPSDGAGPLAGPVAVVTERAAPLTPARAAALVSAHPGAVAWGLHQVAAALAFLHGDCGVVHGNVGLHAVYVTPGGDWKLWGLELAADAASVRTLPRTAPLARFAPGGTAIPPIPPECGGSGSESEHNSGSDGTWCATFDPSRPWTVDAYAYGRLVEAVFGAAQAPIPAPLAAAVRRLTAADPRARPSLAQCLAQCTYFAASPYVRAMRFLDTLALRDAAEQDAFFRDQLPALLAAAPPGVALHKILPRLLEVADICLVSTNAPGAVPGSKTAVPATASTTTATTQSGTLPASVYARTVLPTVLQLGSQLEDREFGVAMAPRLARWIALPDRAVRAALLEGAAHYAARVPAAALAEHYYPRIAEGFLDVSPALRDLTIRSMLVLVPRLPERTVNVDLMRAFARLQVDREPSIRTNTTVCLGKIVRHLAPATRDKVIVPAFGRALKDPFAPARVAGLVALAASREYCAPDAAARTVLPAVAPLLVDPELAVRSEAAKLTKTLLADIEKYAASLPVSEHPAPPQQQQQQQQQQQAPKAVPSPVPASPAPSTPAQSPQTTHHFGAVEAEECADDGGWDDFDADFDAVQAKVCATVAATRPSPSSPAQHAAPVTTSTPPSQQQNAIFDAVASTSGWEPENTSSAAKPTHAMKLGKQSKPSSGMSATTTGTTKAMHLGHRNTTATAAKPKVTKPLQAATAITSSEWSWDDDDDDKSKSASGDGWDADF